MKIPVPPNYFAPAVINTTLQPYTNEFVLNRSHNVSLFHLAETHTKYCDNTMTCNGEAKILKCELWFGSLFKNPS